MCNLCRNHKKKVPPQPTPAVVAPKVATPEIKPKDKSYGYVQLYSGVQTSVDNYSSPVISLHIYNKTRKTIPPARPTLDAATRGNKSLTSTAGPSRIEKEERDEEVRCIPVENIISISYSTDVNKDYQIFETKKERPRAHKPKLSCCDRFKECLRETFCPCPSCPCAVCKPRPIEKPQFDPIVRQSVLATRMLLIKMECIRYTNIHIPSHVKALSNEKQIKFFDEKFDSYPIEFYLVNKTDTEDEEDNFNLKRDEAEKLTRVIVQLRNMVGHYPSPMELDDILQQEQAAFFGDEIDAPKVSSSF